MTKIGLTSGEIAAAKIPIAGMTEGDVAPSPKDPKERRILMELLKS